MLSHHGVFGHCCLRMLFSCGRNCAVIPLLWRVQSLTSSQPVPRWMSRASKLPSTRRRAPRIGGSLPNQLEVGTTVAMRDSHEGLGLITRRYSPSLWSPQRSLQWTQICVRRIPCHFPERSSWRLTLCSSQTSERRARPSSPSCLSTSSRRTRRKSTT